MKTKHLRPFGFFGALVISLLSPIRDYLNSFLIPSKGIVYESEEELRLTKGHVWIDVNKYGEGISNWRKTVSMLLGLANMLNATLIEPCMRNGRLKKCNYPSGSPDKKKANPIESDFRCNQLQNCPRQWIPFACCASKLPKVPTSPIRKSNCSYFLSWKTNTR